MNEKKGDVQWDYMLIIIVAAIVLLLAIFLAIIFRDKVVDLLDKVRQLV